MCQHRHVPPYNLGKYAAAPRLPCTMCLHMIDSQGHFYSTVQILLVASLVWNGIYHIETCHIGGDEVQWALALYLSVGILWTAPLLSL